ncbi:hypothetical protein [Oenococcus sp.]
MDTCQAMTHITPDFGLLQKVKVYQARAKTKRAAIQFSKKAKKSTNKKDR